MHAFSIKKPLKYLGWTVLFSYILWMYVTVDVKVIAANKSRSVGYYHLNVKKQSSASTNHARPHQNRSSINSRRSPAFDESQETKIGAKDLHLQHEHKKTLMQEILKASGQEFGKSVNDPDFTEKHDFRAYQTPRYLKKFKNPCLFRNISLGILNNTRRILQLQCVPYFMIAGFPKCGTTDLWSKLKQHPEIEWLHLKELNFFNRKQYDFLSTEKAVNFYQDSLRASTERIKTCISEKNAAFHPCITGDASVDTIFDNTFWRKLPGNERQREPVLTHANDVHKINPNMKIIVLLREPAERLYSDYLYMSTSVGFVTSPEDFHSTVVDRIGNFTSCRRHRALRACVYDVYDDENIQTYKVRLNVGIYHIFLSDWLKVFSQNNVLVVKSEDTRGSNRTQILMKIFKFLGLRRVVNIFLCNRGEYNRAVPSRQHMAKTYNSQSYMNKQSRSSERMLSKTRKLLQEFYQTFNQQLEQILPHIHY